MPRKVVLSGTRTHRKAECGHDEGITKKFYHNAVLPPLACLCQVKADTRNYTIRGAAEPLPFFDERSGMKSAAYR